MKQVIDLLEEALKVADSAPELLEFIIKPLEKAISKLKKPLPITPKQYQDIEGQEYPDAGAVYRLYTQNDGVSEWFAERYKRDTRPNNRFMALPTVCAYNLKGPPPVDWRPE